MKRLAPAALAAAWIAVVAAVYYRRAWALAAAGPSAWVPDGGWYELEPAIAAWTLAGIVVAIFLAAAAARSPGGTLRRSGKDSAPGPAPPRASRRTLRRLPLAALPPAALLAIAWPSSVNGHLLPWFGEAATRGAWALAAAALVSFDAYACGTLVLRLLGWRGTDWSERLLFRLAAGFGAIAYLSLALALLGWYTPQTVVGLLVAIGLAGAAWLAAPAVVRSKDSSTQPSTPATAATPEGGPGTPGDASAQPGAIGNRAWAAVAIVAGFLALVGALAPETEFDALWYHLALPALWLGHGSAVDVPHEFVSLYPMTWELVFGAALALDGPVAAKLLHFACLPLLALATWRFVRRFFPGSPAWLPAAIVLTVPTVTWEATTTYVDLALALYTTLGLYALLVHLETRGRAWFAAAVLCFGLGAALKHLGLVVLAVVALGLFVQLARTSGTRRGFATAAALGAGALLFGLPWYVRSWALSGNPFFPEMFSLFGASLPARWDAVSQADIAAFKARFGLPRTPLNLLMLPWNATIHGARFGGSLGPVFLAAAPLVAWRGLPSTASRWLAWLVLGYAAVWASPISSFQMRFLVPIVPALALLASAGIAALLRELPGTARRSAVAVTAALLLLNLPPFLPLHEGDREGWDGWLTHVIRKVPLRVVVGREGEDAYLRERVATYGAWADAARLPGSVRVLEFGGGDNYYATRDRLSTDAVIARAAWTPGEEAVPKVLAALSEQHVTHVLFDKSLLPSLQRRNLALLSPAMRPHLRTEYEDGRAVMYRLVAGVRGP